MMARLNITEENPYPSKLLNCLDHISILGMKVFKIPMDITVSCLFMTSEEKKEWYFYVHRYVIIFPIGFLLMILTMPINILGFLLWLLIHEKRKSYRLSYCGKSRKSTRAIMIKPTYGFMTTNVCLMPECMARFNNLTRSGWRCEQMGEIMARKLLNRSSSSHVIDIELPDKNHNTKVPSNNILFTNGVNLLNGHNLNYSTDIPDKTTDTYPSKTAPDFDVSVYSHMPNADFILLQEASWDMNYSKTMVRALHQTYPYVVYDIGIHSLSGNLYVGNSGLMLASKYDILDIRFGLFTSSCKQCRFASKGLLQLKVYLGRSPTGLDVVGYVFNTHLQAYKGDQPIQNEQMDNVLTWTDAFRKETHRPEEEIVAFDILGGDFNLDNMSPVDRDNASHPLFNKYLDVGREKPGKDHEWAKGTEFRQPLIYEPEVNSPESLKSTLEDPTLMQTYLLDADLTYAGLEMATVVAKRDENGKVIASPVGGKRRIDFVLYNQRDEHLKVTNFNAVTALHNLTDHIPYYLSLDITSHPELTEAFVE